MKINYCYACRILNNEMQVSFNLLGLGQAIVFIHCKLVLGARELLRLGEAPLWRGTGMCKVH